jgi:hypothetical protein
MRTSLTRFSVWPYPLPPISSSSSDDDPVNEAFPNVLATLLVDALRRCLDFRHQKFIRSLYVLMRVHSCNVVPQLLLRGSVLSCPALVIAVTLAVASAEVSPIDPIAFGVGVPLALSREGCSYSC